MCLYDAYPCSTHALLRTPFLYIYAPLKAHPAMPRQHIEVQIRAHKAVEK